MEKRAELRAARSPAPAAGHETFGERKLRAAIAAAGAAWHEMHVDARAVRVAAQQHGTIARWQLLAAGLTDAAIAHRVAIGTLHRMHRGVYLVGDPGRQALAAETAAVLACGPSTVLSHHSAAVLWGLVEPRPGPVEVTVATHRRHHAGIRVHRTRPLEPYERREHEGLPVTAPARTLLDQAATLPITELEQAITAAEISHLVNRRSLAAAADRAAPRPGVPLIRELLKQSEGPALTESAAERRLLGLLRAARLPQPQTNARVGAYRVDFLWAKERLIVEVDGFRYHSHRVAFERDRRRDAELIAAGYRVIRVTWRQITEEPEATVALIAQALGQSTREAA